MAESFDIQLAYAGVYGEALFSLAGERGEIERVRGELEELARLEQVEPDFAAFMTSAALDDDVRAASLERMLRGKLSDTLLNTLQVMNEHGRAGLVAALLRDFVVRQEAAAGQIEALATTAVPLDDAQRQAVAQTAQRVTGKAPVMKFQVDESLIGGLVLQIGDLRYDNSVRRQLHVAASRLRERSDRGLAIGAT
ncbi:MAG: ATP synthase F1 subunit delta [Phycisphaerae bacterium]